jgi:hypothetical protein
VGTVTVLLGNGNGTFQAPKDFACGPSPHAVAVGDFNGDGVPDVAVTNYTADTVSVLVGNGNGTFQAPVNYPTGASPYGLSVADFNGDGFPDLAISHEGLGTV